MNDSKLLNWLEMQDGGALINDDAGRWAFASDGVQNLNMENDEAFDLESTWWVEKHAFKTTIREAIAYAMESDKEYLD